MPKLTKDHVLAGKCTFTVENDKHDHYTFRITKVENDNGRPDVWFVSMLAGPDNESSYVYLGVLDSQTAALRATRASKMDETSIPFKVAVWALRLVWVSGSLPDGYSILMSGKCCKCGRTLTTPESIASGVGPECAKRSSFALA